MYSSLFDNDTLVLSFPATTTTVVTAIVVLSGRLWNGHSYEYIPAITVTIPTQRIVGPKVRKMTQAAEVLIDHRCCNMPQARRKMAIWRMMR